ncbi:hypothetical protein TrVGV298_004310 [Trichoderma virens]|nr:hypothetical protein TrVGV298_004310 [Trichoderma virens]
METRSSMAAGRPQSIKELVAQAENFAFNVNIAMKHWIRAADTLYQEASFALSDGDYGRAYMMLYRHSVLRIPRVVDDLEQLKPEIQAAYEEWERAAPSPAIERHKQQAASSYANFAARDPSLSGNARILDAAEHQDLAVDLAQQELSRRERDKRASKHSSVWEARDTANRTSQLDDGDLRRQMEATRRTLDMAQERRNLDAALEDHDRSPPVTTHNYYYPSLSKSRPIDYEQSRYSSSREPQPTRPPKEHFDLPPLRHEEKFDTSNSTIPPQVPRKAHLDDYQPLDATPRPLVDLHQPPLPPKDSVEIPQPKKERLAFKPGGYLENGDPIRSIFLPW